MAKDQKGSGKNPWRFLFYTGGMPDCGYLGIYKISPGINEPIVMSRIHK